VVFAAGAAGSWQRILDATEADAAYDEPTLFHDDVGTFLDLGGHTLGTGQFPLGSLFQHRGESWTKIDVRGWQTELAKRLPKGMSVWRGPYPDYPHFAATAVVRREPPPEGADPDQDDEGYAAIRLALKGDGLTIDRAAWKIGVENPCQIMPDYPGCK
jgi:hypothetical protein